MSERPVNQWCGENLTYLQGKILPGYFYEAVVFLDFVFHLDWLSFYLQVNNFSVMLGQS